MEEKIKHIIAWITIFLVAWLLPITLACLFKRGCPEEDWSIILSIGGAIIIPAFLLSIWMFKKEYGGKWLITPKTVIPKDAQKELKSFRVTFLLTLGITIVILGLILGIVIQDMLLIWIFILTGITIASPAGYVATKWEPMAKKSFKFFLIFLSIYWFSLIYAVIRNPWLYKKWLQVLLEKLF